MTLARVGHLETVVRVPDAASPLRGRLADLAAERLPGALALAVERALTETGEVVVFRHVELELTLEANGSAGAEEVTHRWAGASGAAVAAASARGDAQDVVRFPDEATFVAHFVRDLLAGRAWEMWYYGAFSALRGLPVSSAVGRALGSHAHVLAAVVRGLARQQVLDQALSALRPDDAASVWQRALAWGPQPLDAVSALPIAAGALTVAGRLQLLVGPAPEPAELAASHRRWAPQPLEWSSPSALADAVAGALAELGCSGLLSEPAPGLHGRAEGAVADLDWLDRERLVTAIVRLLDPAGQDETPLVEDADADAARRSIEEAGLQPARRHADDPKVALRLLAALAELDPGLAAGPAAAARIQRLLEHSAAAPGTGLSERGSGGSRAARAASGPAWNRCQTAGMLLVTRALVDTRLAGLASRLALPAPGLAGDPSAALLLAVALALAGPDGVRGDRLDRAIVALIGSTDAVTVSELATAWSATDAAQHRRLRAELAGLAAGQRLDRPRPVRDCRHPAVPGLARGTVARAAHLALMAWARWLRGLSGSTPTYLLAQLLRRGGSVNVGEDCVRVVLDPRPLDVVIELAGYFEPLHGVPWLAGRTLHITRDEA